MAKKKKISWCGCNDKLEKIGGLIALGVIVILLIMIVAALIIKFCFNSSEQVSDDAGTQSSSDLQISGGIDTSSQLEDDLTQILLPASDEDTASSGAEKGDTMDSAQVQESVQPSSLTSGTISPLYNREFLNTEDYPQVTELIQTYFEAYKSCSSAELISLVDFNGGTPITQDEMEQRAQIVEDYLDISCYMIEGMDSNSYVVYASYNIKFYNISTPAPTLTRFYVVTYDDETVRIYNGEVTAKLNAYLKSVNEYDDVKGLSETVDEAFKKACSEDERLRELMEILYGQEFSQKAEEQE